MAQRKNRPVEEPSPSTFWRTVMVVGIVLIIVAVLAVLFFSTTVYNSR